MEVEDACEVLFAVAAFREHACDVQCDIRDDQMAGIQVAREFRHCEKVQALQRGIARLESNRRVVNGFFEESH